MIPDEFLDVNMIFDALQGDAMIGISKDFASALVEDDEGKVLPLGRDCNVLVMTMTMTL